MTVKNRLSLYCTMTFGFVFTIMSVFIYWLYFTNGKKSVYSHLENTAFISAWFYLEEDELSCKEFEKIREQFENTAANSNYQVYDSLNRIAYGVKPEDISTAILDEIRQKGHLRFSFEDYLCYGIFYEDNQGDFVVIAKEKKQKLHEQLSMLLWIILLSFFIGITAIILLSRWVARLAYKPFCNVITEVRNISTHNLDVQIHPSDTNDELDDLIQTFNDLLTKISETIIMQKNFVRYISHEFKTPLTTILGNLDLFSLRMRTPEEYKDLSNILIKQAQQIKEILDTLIVVADLKKDDRIIQETRIDDLIWEIIERIKSRYPKSVLLVNIDILPEDEKLMYSTIDQTQLSIALYNLIENATKYSDNQPVTINIYKESNSLYLSIIDKGIGIPITKLEEINKPFFRADNAKQVEGEGIGLSLALRILKRNNIIYKIESKVDVGTSIYIKMP
ncbi:HAMP domain-containing sensor histidine kinase [Bacteroides helcogenes]|uniref:histidine kinase n=1 Tax=Bacteroides helcogenes (strain ATCC 35417 / DSM 20613 / JCM 6297 / CCUG 15421 / P 36-108) TaxID=693979 RepID=E6STY4_BACT6|nr:HAMP domain-containing sensor histidine kinase [Bacteroides helcogenes]ADV43285.1 integral membrane sensor signal transduction histidine kinase [Bacteroides helcogenes P 36-108]MDY5238624.1 HAMP domain-containing sensor histidine kinase [Bacteroides helcogenes]